MAEQGFNIENDLINQSWDHMNKILDKEMPVKRNRGLGLIFLLGIVLFSILMLLWSQHKAISGIEKTKLNIPIVETGESRSKDKISSVDNQDGTAVMQNPIDKNESILIAKSSENLSKNINIQANPSILNEISESSKSIEPISEADEKPIVSVPQSSGESDINSGSVLKSEKIKATDLTYQFNTLLNVNKLAYSNFLPVYSLVSRNVILPETTPIEPQKKATSPVMDIGFYAGLKSNPSQSFFGYSAGVFSKLHLMRNINLVPGFGYSKHSYPMSIGSFENQDALDEVLNTGTTEMDPSLEASALTIIDLESSNQLEWSLAAEFQLKSNIFLSLAGQYAYTISAVNTVEKNFQPQRMEVDEKYIINTGNLQRSQWSIFGGLNWSITNSIDLVAGYHYGLNNLISPSNNSSAVNTIIINQEFERNSYFDVKFRFRIK